MNTKNVLQPYCQCYHCWENSYIIRDLSPAVLQESRTLFGLVNGRTVVSKLDLSWNLPTAALRAAAPILSVNHLPPVSAPPPLAGKENMEKQAGNELD